MLSTLMVGEGGEPGGVMEAGMGIGNVEEEEIGEDGEGEEGEEEFDMVGDGGGESSWRESLREEEEGNVLGGDGWRGEVVVFEHIDRSTEQSMVDWVG